MGSALTINGSIQEYVTSNRASQSFIQSKLIMIQIRIDRQIGGPVIEFTKLKTFQRHVDEFWLKIR